MAQEKQEKPVIIYDGECPICRKTIGWIRANSKEGTFELLTCQSESTAERFPFIDEEACMQAMHLILQDGSVFPGEKALPEILRRMERYTSAARLFRLPGAETVSRNFYRLFADNRYTIAKVLLPGEKKRLKNEGPGN